MTEIWRGIKDYEGLYQVNNLGRVKSLKRTRIGNGGSIVEVKECILKQFNIKGYQCVSLSKNGIQKIFRVHRLVAMAFPDLVDWTEEAKGKPFDELQVNHKDEFDKTNNRVDNLEWCTGDYNLHYGTLYQRTSKSLTNRKDLSKPVYQYTLDMVFIKEYPSAKEAERQTGINASQIRRCCKGFDYEGYKSLTAGGYIWKFKD